jgi:hypothetical protein
MGKEGVPEISKEFIIYKQSGLPKYGKYNVIWEKADICGF